MATKPNKISRFWQELKRRKVTRVITVYAAAAFVILQLVEILAPSLRLPDWTMNLVLVLLIVGFIITVILSWIYDIHPEGGVIKTEPVEKVKAGDIPESSQGWKIASYVSFGVILVMVSILLYPKIFKPDKFKELRDNEGMITVAVLPFNNLTGDSSLYYWQNGISELLINGLAQSDELLLFSSHMVQDVLTGTKQVYSASLTPELARRTASKISASTHITGNYIGSGSNVSIVLNMINTENGELIWTTRVDGNLNATPQHLIDRLSDTVRNYLEIKALEDRVDTDLTHSFPNSADAYRYYIDGLNAIVASEYEMAIESLLKAYELDTTFTFAAFYLAFAHSFGGSGLFEGQYRWIKRAYELKENIPLAFRPWIEMWYACDKRDYDDIRRYCDMLFEAAHHSRFILLDLGVTYYAFLQDYDKSIQAFEKVHALNQRWEDNWKYERYYGEYTWVLLLADRPEMVEHIADIGLKINPKNEQLVRRKGAAALLMGDSADVQQSRVDFMSLAKEQGISEAFTEFLLGNMHRWGKDYRQAADHYRKAYELDKEDRNSLIWLIYSQLRGDLNIEECLKLSEYGLSQNPESLSFRWGKGVSLHKLGRPQEALSILLPLKERMPYNRELQRDIQEVEQSLALQQK
jgi:tetratricopeptide (TPR) repeat protein